FLALSEEAARQYGTARAAMWLRRLDTDHDNLRAALAWSLAVGDAPLAQRLAGALAGYWEARGYLSEGRAWLEAALAVGSGPDHGPAAAAARTQVLTGVGVLAARQHDLVPAEAAF